MLVTFFDGTISPKQGSAIRPGCIFSKIIMQTLKIRLVDW